VARIQRAHIDRRGFGDHVTLHLNRERVIIGCSVSFALAAKDLKRRSVSFSTNGESPRRTCQTMTNTDGEDAPAPTEADRDAERERLQRMRDAIKRLLDRHEHAVAEQRRREAAS
jgi:hypothetical protein